MNAGPRTVGWQGRFPQSTSGCSIPKAETSSEELRQREAVRSKLLKTAVRCLETQAEYEKLPFDSSLVGLHFIFSQHDGYGIAGSDLDLLLVCPECPSTQDPIESFLAIVFQEQVNKSKMAARVFVSQTGDVSLRGCDLPDDETKRNILEACTKESEIF